MANGNTSLREEAVFEFIKQSIREFHHTGAVAPSSRRLARVVTAHLNERGEEPIEILEAGPGTGALTVEIVRHLRPGDHLTLVEINPGFVAHLKKRFESDPLLAPWREQVTIHQGPVQEIEGEDQFAHIVCGLPFNNFQPDMIRTIFETFDRVLKPGGKLSYFEYAGIRVPKAIISSRAERDRLRSVVETISDIRQSWSSRKQLISLNLPPALAHTLWR